MRRRAKSFAWKERSSAAINFGWGMVAHIYPGGKLVLEQTDAGGGRWIFTHFTEQLTVRALMVKTHECNDERGSVGLSDNHGPDELPGRDPRPAEHAAAER